MALIIRGSSLCALCETLLLADEDILAFPAFIAERSDDLWRFSDSAVHSSCFLTWERRNQFVERFNSTARWHIWGNDTYHRMTSNGDIEVVTEVSATIRLGDEFDQDVRLRLQRVLRELGAEPGQSFWGVGGSQEISRLSCRVLGHEITIEAETYMGLSVSGPQGLIEEIERRVSAYAG